MALALAAAMALSFAACGAPASQPASQPSSVSQPESASQPASASQPESAPVSVPAPTGENYFDANNIPVLDEPSDLEVHAVAYDMEDSTRLQGEFRWHFVRMDASQRNLAEKLSSGRWLLAATFEKKEGAWAEIRSNVPDEAWREFRQDGIACSFRKEGGKVEQTESAWSVNLSTGELRIYQDAANWHSSIVELENDSTLAIFCSGNAPGPGNVPHPAGTPGAKERKELYTLHK